jgi:hypothetical protein
MSQHDLTIANQGFPAFRADLNSALQALGSTQSGTAAPSPTFANQLWYDTANNILKIRNEDNDAWISIATLDQSGDLVALLVANTVNSVGDSTISGLTVGKGAGAVATNTAVGASALVSGSQTGINNTAVGQTALTSNTSGSENSALGRQSLFSNTTGGSNSGFGMNALVDNTTGSFNTAVGRAALQSNTTASNNTAVGYQAGYTTTVGNTTSVGYRAGYLSTTGGSWVAVGNESLYSNTTGSENTSLGSAALFANTTGSSNVAVGRTALFSNTTANNNTAVGYQAGYTNVTGAGNTFIGQTAGYTSNAGASNGFNTCIGFAAGYALTTGIQNTFIGTPAVSNGAGGVITTGSYNTIIGGYNGNTGGLDIRTASNYIVLSDGAGNPRGVFDGSGNFRLGGATFAVGTDGTSLKANGQLLSNCNVDWNQELYGSQTGRIRFLSSNGSTTQVGTITVNTTNTAYNTSSDHRLKENIAPMTGALAKVSQLKPCTYTWKVDGSDGQGFIAHELAEVVPQAVTGEKDAVDKDGNINPQGIDTSFLVATLVAAIQELKAEFDAYKATHP